MNICADYQRQFIGRLECVHDKYAVTAKTLVAQRDTKALQLQAFLVEMGYE